MQGIGNMEDPKPPAGAVPKPSRLNGLVGGGVVAIAVKLSSAGLNFFMFLMAALVTTPRDFGLFSTIFAAASLVSFVNVVGQQSVALRFWPQYAGAGRMTLAYAMLWRSIATVAAGLLLGAALFGLAGILPLGADLPEWLALCLCGALLSVVLGWSEFLSSVLRARGQLLGALLPRDIIWRAAFVAALGLAWLVHGPLPAVWVALICGGLLALCMLGQTIRLLFEVARAPRQVLTAAETAEFSRVTYGLWGVNAIPPALGQISTLLVAAILGPEIAGAVFVAERTARLIDLPLNGINQVLAPHISRNFHLKGASSVQYASSLTAVVSFAIAVATMAVFAILGTWMLGLFDPVYANETMWIVLMIFGLSLTLSAACGPTALLLQLTGHQDALLRIFTLAGVAGVPLTAFAAWQFGPVGAAVAIALTMAASTLVPVRVAIREIGVNPTILGWVGARKAESLAGST
jgi:O-antigen/teichoic acid export membrane protein